MIPRRAQVGLLAPGEPDRYGRRRAVITLSDSRDLAEMIVESGMALTDTDGPNDERIRRLLAIEAEARGVTGLLLDGATQAPRRSAARKR